MIPDPIYTPPEGPPQGNAPILFDRIGLEKLYTFTARQYRLLGESAISRMFPSDAGELTAASRKQAEFLCGILGGPRIYVEKHGPPRMRARHFPFAIDPAARAEWLRCFREALREEENLDLNESDTRALIAWIEAFSAWMVNRP